MTKRDFLRLPVVSLVPFLDCTLDLESVKCWVTRRQIPNLMKKMPGAYSMRLAKNSLITLIAVFCSAFPVFAQDQAQNSSGKTQTVVSEGVGQTAEAAIKDAFRNAVRQVVGAVVDAETQIKNDELISDKVLTYSDGFIKRYEEIEKEIGKDGVLYRVKIKAEVERRTVVQTLRDAKVSIKLVDGNSLYAEAVTQNEAKESAKELLKSHLERFPQSILTAKVVGEPKVISQTASDAVLKMVVQIEPDTEAYDSFSVKMIDYLEKMAIAKGAFIHQFPFRGGTGETAIYSDRPLLSEIDQKLFSRFPARVRAIVSTPESNSVVIAVANKRNKQLDRIDYKCFELSPELGRVFRATGFPKPTVIPELLDEDGNQIKTKIEQKKFDGSLVYRWADGEKLVLFSPTFLWQPKRQDSFVYNSPYIQISYEFSLELEQLRSLRTIKASLVFED